MSDIARFVRLKHTIQSAAGALPEDQGPVSAAAFTTTFNRLHQQVRDALPGSLVGEFDALFPQFANTSFDSHDLFGQSAASNDARLRLQSLSGWLDGIIATEADDPADI